MKKIFSVLVLMAMVISCTGMIASAAPGSLNDVIGETEVKDDKTSLPAEDKPIAPATQEEIDAAKKAEKDAAIADRNDKNSSYISGMQDATDLTPEVEGLKPVTDTIKLVASWIVQVLSYVIIAFLGVRVLLDVSYIVIPPIRSFLANGYGGTPQNAGEAGGMGAVGGMGGGMPGMGGGYGGGGYGGNRYGNRYGGGMGMGGGMGGGMNPVNQMSGQNTVMNNQSNRIGRMQWVSNAALNAVASESGVGPDGKAMSPFKVYIKDMAIVLVITPVLITLAATGVVANFGFLLAEMLVDGIRNLGNMI